MSIITAKFPSLCVSCRQRIAVGDKISWVKGKKPHCMKCEEGGGRKARAVTSRRVIGWAGHKPVFEDSDPELKALMTEVEKLKV